MYNIFTSTLGIKCALPVSYARQQSWAAPAEPHLSHRFININNLPLSREEGREYVSCTGKYDNISFNLKTPYWHTYNLYNWHSPINNTT